MYSDKLNGEIEYRLRSNQQQRVHVESGQPQLEVDGEQVLRSMCLP